ncbi:AraC family transcriptional regulator (plasmid) [Rhizorhabdus wittichii]|uniref:AraC family transcriptional regulator n=1 Tax=Rhizorhabdus wittichii TaxID=160791 RepID=A0A975HIT9_9SPHN|nr:AraC family transcriptional regulator [Rhizorhabdus wittichii]QTH24989.1 AraC family transcriptional regulator [Rhizorhabdus wittichii]
MDSLATLQQIVRQHGGEGNTQTALPNVSVYQSQVSTEFMHAMYEPSICFVLQGAKVAMLGTASFAYDCAHYLVVAVDLPLAGSITVASPQEPYLGLRLKLDLEALRTLVLDLPPDGGRSDPTDSLMLGTVTPDLLDPLARLLGLLARPRDIPIMAPLIEREILYRLVQGPEARMLRQLVLADSRISQVNRAIEWIKRHYNEAFSVSTVAAAANMSPSAFHQHFKAATSLSPLQYQKQIRLHEARRLILSERMEAGKAGFEVGYDSPSQFSREYKRVFGAPPAREVSRFRQLSQAERSAA